MKRKLVSLFLSLSLMVVSVTGCQSDSVTEETKKEVQTKKSQVLSLYKEIETMIQKNFAKMKDKLTSMSKKVDEKIEDTTEEDAKQAITELKRLETNLQQTKKNVEAHIAK